MNLTQITNTPEEKARGEAQHAREEAAREAQGWDDLVNGVALEDWALAMRGKSEAEVEAFFTEGHRG